MNPVTLKGRKLACPIIQGGMGVGVSLGGLAGAVASCGGMGIISTALPGYRDPDFSRNPDDCDDRAIFAEIAKAKKIADGAGLVGVNIMVAMKRYAEIVTTAIQAGADTIISGAGLPLDLPALTKGANVALAPIVSSARAAQLICRRWDKQYGVTPDFIVVEGPEAGGHLGFSADSIEDGTAETPEQIIPQLRRVLTAFEEKYKRHIPVFAAGGVFNGADIQRMTDCGADGVQIATRFIATHECDASDAYKQYIVDAKDEDVMLIKSPVGMPGRAVRSPLTERMGTRQAPKKCIKCLSPCDPATTPYCISSALVQAVKGNIEDGLFFCGSNVGRINRIVSVRELMDELTKEWRSAL